MVPGNIIRVGLCKLQNRCSCWHEDGLTEISLSHQLAKTNERRPVLCLLMVLLWGSPAVDRIQVRTVYILIVLTHDTRITS